MNEIKKPTVYLETSTISYLTSRPTEEPIRRAKQILTHRWWELRSQFDAYISQTVLEEIEGGDPIAASARLKFVGNISILSPTETVRPLARHFLQMDILPAKAEADAIHIAYAAVYDVQFLVTWNQKHIASVSKQRLIEAVLERYNLRMPRLLTPEQHLIIMEESL